MTRAWLIFLFAGAGLSVYSQQRSDSVRALHIKSYPDHFFVWPVLKQRSLSFDVANVKEKERMEFKPNNSYTVGIGAYVFDLALEATFAVPLNERSRTVYGESKAKDFQINTLSRKWGADFFYQKYRGFYADDESLQTGDAPSPQRDDITTKNFGFTGLYVFDDEKFSLRSAFNFSERQIKRGGSFLLTSTVNSFKLQADSSVIEEEYQGRFGAGSSFRKLRYTTFSLAPGYAYNWVYKNFFISGALMIGPAHNWTYYLEEDQDERNDIRINFFSSMRLGLGYSNDRFFAGLNFVNQARTVRFEQVQVTASTSTFRLLVGYRFLEFGVLKKSIWDFPKELLRL